MKRSVDNRVLVRFRPKNHILDFLGETPGIDSFGQWRRSFDIGHETYVDEVMSKKGAMSRHIDRSSILYDKWRDVERNCAQSA